LKAEFAQSYIAQPKISFLSLITACGVAILSSGKGFDDSNSQNPNCRYLLRKWGNVIESLCARH
ncbi:MAG TPA: hypothetical protein VIS72_02560, partial [Anaerolineales bacterium]